MTVDRLVPGLVAVAGRVLVGCFGGRAWDHDKWYLALVLSQVVSLGYSRSRAWDYGNCSGDGGAFHDELWGELDTFRAHFLHRPSFLYYNSLIHLRDTLSVTGYGGR